MIKIFQIGFNRCGTTSLYELFKKNGYNSIHWANGELAKTLLNNKNNNLPLLTDINDYVFYSDMEFVSSNQIIEGYKMFDLLDKQYPGSKFILNTRSVDNWISSRLNHTNGYKIINRKVVELIPPEPYYLTHLNMYQINSIPTLVNIWRKEWKEHHSKVKQYFKHRPKDLLIFDIENDSFEKIVEFFEDENIRFTTNSLPLVNKTQVTA